ncbi:MAG: penicillin-binding protein activator LpoB [Puniceicoccaceae bacterium]
MNTLPLRSSFARLLAPLALVVTLAGCNRAIYVDPQGNETIVSLDKINIQDFNQAADEMVANLLSSGALSRAPQQPSVMAISQIVNNTRQQLDTNMLTKKIRVALNQSGSVFTTTTTGLGGTAEDPLARDQAEFARFTEAPEARAEARPYWSLSGRIIEDRAEAGTIRKTKQTTYIFQLSLTEIPTGLAVWENEKQITKQGSGNRVGW